MLLFSLNYLGSRILKKVNKKCFLHSSIFVSYPKLCKPELLLQINAFQCH